MVLSKSSLKRLRKKEALQTIRQRDTSPDTTSESNQAEVSAENSLSAYSNGGACAALSPLLIDVDSKAFEIAPALSPGGGANKIKSEPDVSVRVPIAQPQSPSSTIAPIPPPQQTEKLSPAAFTPFSGPSMVPSPVYSSESRDQALRPPLSSGPPPGFTPVRSMRSARVGIIGSGGVKPAALEEFVHGGATADVVSTSSRHEISKINGSSASAEDSMTLLSLLLGNSNSIATAASSATGKPKVAPSDPQCTRSTSSISDGYYVSKSGFSVRLS